MPDGTHPASSFHVRARRTIQRIDRHLLPFWEHRLILVACALFLFGFMAPQTAEFMDDALLSCLAPSDCNPADSRPFAGVQFLGLTTVCLGFSLLLWRLGEQWAEPADAPAAGAPEALAGWVPALAGAACLVLACCVLIVHTGGPLRSSAIAWWPVASALAGAAAGWWYPRSAHPRRALVAALGLLGFVVLTLRPFDPAHEWANYIVPALPPMAGYFVLRPLPGRQQLKSKPLLLQWVLPVTALFYGMLFAAGSLHVYSNGQVRIWTLPILLLLPACYAMIVVRYRLAGPPATLKERLRSPASSAPAPLLWSLCAGFGLLALAGNLWPVETARVVNAPTAIVVFIALILLLATAFVRAVPRPIRWFSVLAYVLVLFLRGIPAAPLLSIAAPIKAAPCTEAPSICDSKQAVARFLAEWERQRPAVPDAPVLLVAAAGGGARAAAHTSAVLAAVDAATCGAFGERLFAISGVSGGAVGGALYAASRADLRTAQDWDACKRLPKGERPSFLLPRLIQASTGDHLSAPLLRTLFRDLPSSLLLVRRSADGQGYDDVLSRAGALSQAWYESYDRMLSQRVGGKAATNSFASGPVGEPGSSPLMLFNATSVQDGMRVLLNRASVCPADSWCGGKNASYLSMAMDSARFPLISPAAARDVFGWDQYSSRPLVTERAVVDGGYFDNTGVSTLLDVMDGLEAAKIARGRIFAILITSDPQEGRAPASLTDFSDQGALSQLLGPVSTVIQTRDGRSRLAVHELQRRLGACNVLYWSMSDKTLNPLTGEMLKVLQSNPEGDAFAALHGERQFVREREPALGWALSQRSGHQLERFARARALPFEFGDFAHANDRKLAIGLGIPVKLPPGESGGCPGTPPNP